MAYIFIGILIGIITTYFYISYISVILNTYLDVFSYIQSERATESQIISQMMALDFKRDYPECDEIEKEEKSPLIGFTCNSSDEYDGDDELG